MWMYYKTVVLKCVSYSGLPEVVLQEHKSKTSYFTYNRQQYLQREKTRELWYMFVLVQAHQTQIQLKEGWAKKVLRRKQSRQHVACLRKNWVSILADGTVRTFTVALEGEESHSWEKKIPRFLRGAVVEGSPSSCRQVGRMDLTR